MPTAEFETSQPPIFKLDRESFLDVLDELPCRTLLTVSRVCRTWRELLLEEASLWDNVAIGMDEQHRMYHEDICYGPEHLPALMPYAKHVKFLQIYGSAWFLDANRTEKQRKRFLKQIVAFIRTANNLESLAIDLTSNDQCCDTCLERSWNLTRVIFDAVGTHAHKLKSLILRVDQTITDRKTLRSLTTHTHDLNDLMVTFDPPLIHAKSLATVLNNWTRLERVFVKGTIQADNELTFLRLLNGPKETLTSLQLCFVVENLLGNEHLIADRLRKFESLENLDLCLHNRNLKIRLSTCLPSLAKGAPKLKTMLYKIIMPSWYHSHSLGYRIQEACKTFEFDVQKHIDHLDKLILQSNSSGFIKKGNEFREFLKDALETKRILQTMGVDCSIMW